MIDPSVSSVVFLGTAVVIPEIVSASGMVISVHVVVPCRMSSVSMSPSLTEPSIAVRVVMEVAMALLGDRLHPFFEIEVFDSLSLGFLPADQDSVEMGNFPEFWID